MSQQINRTSSIWSFLHRFFTKSCKGQLTVDCRHLEVHPLLMLDALCALLFCHLLVYVYLSMIFLFHDKHARVKQNQLLQSINQSFANAGSDAVCPNSSGYTGVWTQSSSRILKLFHVPSSVGSTPGKEHASCHCPPQVPCISWESSPC